MGIFSIFKSKKKDKKYSLGLHKTREASFKTLKELLDSNKKIDEELFDSLEEVFISADIGVNTVVKFIEDLKDDVDTKGITTAKELQELIIDQMFSIYLKGQVVNANLSFNDNGLSVFLFVGVNGVGKTTSIAKIANQLKNEGKKVLLAAGDTFRAGAVEQLKEWSRRIGVDILYKEAGSDPSSVIHDACVKAKQEGYDILLCDTAGRLQNKDNLMAELGKIKRVISRLVENAPHDTLLVVDATTGQNGMSQAKAFKEITDVSGVILTKLDGSSKGGIVLAIRNEIGIPIKYVGLGEKVDDLMAFDIEEYLYALFADFFE